MNVWVLTYLNSVGADSVWVNRSQAQGRAYDLGTQGIETILEPFDVIGVPAPEKPQQALDGGPFATP